MRVTTYMVCVFAAVLLICLAILQLPSPLSDFTQADCVWWLTWDRDIHVSYLRLPEAPYSTGTYESHRTWINNFNEIISRVKKEPCKLTQEECIQLLYLAQASHAGGSATEYSTIQWDRKWFEAYEHIIEYMRKL